MYQPVVDGQEEALNIVQAFMPAGF